MTRLPKIRRRIQPLDPIYYPAFPTYYGLMAVYGYLAAVDFLPSIVQSTGTSYAKGYGITIGIVCTLAAAAAIRSIRTDKPFLELVTSACVIALMVVYAASIFTLYFQGLNPMSSPRSAFIPIVFAVFPFFRVLAIGRSGRLQGGRT